MVGAMQGTIPRGSNLRARCRRKDLDGNGRDRRARRDWPLGRDRQPGRAPCAAAARAALTPRGCRRRAVGARRIRPGRPARDLRDHPRGTRRAARLRGRVLDRRPLPAPRRTRGEQPAHDRPRDHLRHRDAARRGVRGAAVADGVYVRRARHRHRPDGHRPARARNAAQRPRARRAHGRGRADRPARPDPRGGGAAVRAVRVPRRPDPVGAVEAARWRRVRSARRRRRACRAAPAPHPAPARHDAAPARHERRDARARRARAARLRPDGDGDDGRRAGRDEPPPRRGGASVRGRVVAHPAGDAGTGGRGWHDRAPRGDTALGGRLRRRARRPRRQRREGRAARAYTPSSATPPTCN